MKLSNTLLNAIFIGMATGGVASCTGITDTVSEFNGEQTEVIVCGDTDGEDGSTKNPWENCMACGMG